MLAYLLSSVLLWINIYFFFYSTMRILTVHVSDLFLAFCSLLFRDLEPKVLSNTVLSRKCLSESVVRYHHQPVS